MGNRVRTPLVWVPLPPSRRQTCAQQARHMYKLRTISLPWGGNKRVPRNYCTRLAVSWAHNGRRRATAICAYFVASKNFRTSGPLGSRKVSTLVDRPQIAIAVSSTTHLFLKRAYHTLSNILILLRTNSPKCLKLLTLLSRVSQ